MINAPPESTTINTGNCSCTHSDNGRKSFIKLRQPPVPPQPRSNFIAQARQTVGQQGVIIDSYARRCFLRLTRRTDLTAHTATPAKRRFCTSASLLRIPSAVFFVPF